MEDFDKKVLDACHRIEDLYHETDGKCYVSFSGGKDSTVILALIKLCEEVYTIPKDGIPAVFSNTGIELGVTIDFVKWVKENYYPNLQVIRPDVPFSQVIDKHGKPLRSKMKSELLHRWHKQKRSKSLKAYLVYGTDVTGTKTYATTKLANRDMHMLHDKFDIKASRNCCDYMKKKPFRKYEKENDIKGKLIGMRDGEGGARMLNSHKREHYWGKRCTYTSHNVIYKLPIVDWTDEDVEMFIKRYNVPLSKAYTLFNFTRTGCMACPYARDVDNNLQYLFEHEKNRYKASMFWLKDVYIAQDVKLPFDKEYEKQRRKKWLNAYEPMRQEMLRKYRPNSRLIKEADNVSIFDLIDEENEKGSK